MAKICNADKNKDQKCGNCKWYQYDYDRSADKGYPCWTCCNPNKDFVSWEADNGKV